MRISLGREPAAARHTQRTGVPHQPAPRIRILLVVEPGIDGVFRQVEGLTHFLLSKGQEVHLAYSDRRASEGLERLLALVRNYEGECLNLRVGNAPEPRDVVALWKLYAFARRLHPVVVHAHSSKAGVLGRMLALLGVRARFFYSPHAYYGLAPRPSPLKTALYAALERLFGKIGATINISADEAAFARKVLGVPDERIRVIHNPVDAAIFVPANAEQKAKARAVLGLPQDALVLGAIGRLSFQKNPQLLYRAAAPVLKVRSNVVLLHVGQGELEDELRRLADELGINSRIVRNAYLNKPVSFYHAVDALIVTSRYEAGWPVVVLEAISCDLPVIVSEAPGTSDIRRGGLSHCWSAPSENIAEFTRAIEAWLADREITRTMNHRETALSRFSTERCYGALLEEYKKSVTSWP